MESFLKETPLPCIVDGKPFKTASTYDVVKQDDPTATVHKVHCASVEDAIEAVESCQRAFVTWKKSTILQRRNVFLKAAALLQDRIGTYSAMTVEETCLPRNYAAFELAYLARTHLEETVGSIAPALASEVLPDTTGDNVRMHVYRKPYGVVLGIAPWNAPFLLGMRAVLDAIAAGNTAILKSSEHAPRVALCVAQLLYDAGLPAGVLSVLHVDPKDAPAVTEAMISHRAVRKVNFTGSTHVGRIIGQVCAKYLKPVVLELGGKAPNIVLDDADLDIVANNVLFGGFVNSNQICMAVTNIFAHRSVAEPLQRKLAEEMQAHSDIFTAKRAGQAGAEDKHGMRALFSEASGTKVKGLYDDAMAKGAQVIAGKPGFDGALVQPIVLGAITTDMHIYTQETFGPILNVIPFDTIEEVIERANSTSYGLAAAVFGRDIDKALAVAHEIEAGQVHVNGQSVHDHGQMPHGGWKESGFGRFNGFHGIREFTQLQGITLQQGSKLPYEMM